MKVVMPRVYSPAGFAVVLALHAFLLYLLLLERPGTQTTATSRYSQLLFVLPPPPKPAVKNPDAPRSAANKNRPRKTEVDSSPVQDRSAQPVELPPSAAPADPFSENIPINIDSLLRQAGKADRETRPEREMQAYGPLPGSVEAIMTKAFNEARLAVPLKWYEAARITELSPPGARKPIYQVKTAFGTYCLYYPDKLMRGTGDPKMADCPRSFGR